MTNKAIKNNVLDTEIIDTIIGYNEKVQNDNKQLQSKRIREARRAIEKHRELKELSKALNDDWLDYEPVDI